MKYGIFDIEAVTYPAPAAGWGEDGVYRCRAAVKSEYSIASDTEDGTANDIPSDSTLRLYSRHFRETESTGYGVFDYAEGVLFSFESGIRDYTYNATLENRGDEPISVSAYANDITKLAPTEIAPQSEVTVSFTLCSTKMTSSVLFFASTPEYTTRESAREVTFYIRELTAILNCDRGSGRKPTVFLASDSTVQTYDPYYYPQTGWGEVLYKFFRDADFVREYRPEGSSYSHCRSYELPEITIQNCAIGGRSSRSFMLEGKFDELLSRARRGDFVFIQFGHNDSTKARPNRYVSVPEYGAYLREYATACLARGITPVFVTPVMRRNYDERGGGSFSISFAEHREEMMTAASELDVPVLDLGLASYEICCALGGEAAKSLFMWVDAGAFDFGAYIKGCTDNTHLQRRGALCFAGVLARLIVESDDKRLGEIAGKINPNADYNEYIKELQ